jgi:hypothetical protein
MAGQAPPKVPRNTVGLRKGRAKGALNKRTVEAQEALAKLGGDPPHVALLEIGRDEKTSEAGRISALAACSAFFQPKMAPLPPPPRYIENPVGLDLTDAHSALLATAAIGRKLDKGEIAIESADALLRVVRTFANLFNVVELQREVEKARGLHGA